MEDRQPTSRYAHQSTVVARDSRGRLRVRARSVSVIAGRSVSSNREMRTEEEVELCRHPAIGPDIRHLLARS